MATYYDGYGNKVDISGSAPAVISEGELDGDIEMVLPLSKWASESGYINSSKVWTSTTSEKYKVVPVPVSGGDTLRCVGSASNTRIYFLTEFNLAEGETASYSAESGFDNVCVYENKDNNAITVPSDATYAVVQMINNGADTSPSELTINGINYTIGIREALHTEQYRDVNWIAFGDSITSGYYSYIDDSGNSTSRATGTHIVWPYKVAQANHWNFTNMGYGGMGYLMSSSGQSYQAYNRVKEISDYSGYNLCTLAYGVNDWKGNRVMGAISDGCPTDTPTTVIGAMMQTIEYLISQNSDMKIIVILPFNCVGYSFDYGDESTNYGRGYSFDNTGTLEEFTDKLIGVCDYYGIEYIDCTRYSVINRKNLRSMLLDGVHPSEPCHSLIARDMANRITFK